jgi:hypothetical protein
MKKIQFNVLIIFLFFISAGSVFSQNEKPVRLLEQWMGTWKGQLEITTSEGKNSEVNMKLDISETETPGVWKWVVNYGDTFLGNYLLRLENSTKGTYILDENNSILLDYFFLDNTFYCTLSTQGSILVSKYQMKNDNILFEVITSSMNSANISDSGADENSIVYSYPVFAIQKAALTKE